MADQATMNVNGGPRVNIDSPLTEGVLGNLAAFGADCTTLLELQSQLAAEDLKASSARAAVPTGVAAFGAALGLSALPVALLGVGELIVQYGGLTRGWSYVIVAVAAMAVGGLAAWLFGSRIGAAFEPFTRSREELSRNLAWVKTVLAHSGRTGPQARRKS